MLKKLAVTGSFRHWAYPSKALMTICRRFLRSYQKNALILLNYILTNCFK